MYTRTLSTRLHLKSCLYSTGIVSTSCVLLCQQGTESTLINIDRRKTIAELKVTIFEV